MSNFSFVGIRCIFLNYHVLIMIITLYVILMMLFYLLKSTGVHGTSTLVWITRGLNSILMVRVCTQQGKALTEGA